MKYFYLLLLAIPQFLTAQLNTSFQSQTNYTPSVNDVWGYAAGGREYALVGLRTGVNIQDVTDPANPVDKGTATGVTSGWRDIKTYSTYAYVTNESNNGIMIIDLSNLATASITASDYWDWDPTIAGLGDLNTCHNLYIDGAGYAYLAGCNLNSGGILYVDLFTDPANPSYVDKGPAIYAHDVFVDGNRMYTSEIYDGEFGIYNIANKANTIDIGSSTTPGNFTHNVWTDGSTAFTTDEIGNGTVGAYDINDLNNIELLDEFKPLATVNTGVIPHNVHLLNGYVVTSHYSDGVVIIDGSVPDNLIEVGNYDTYTGGGTGFNGAWGAYPFLPSGNILVSDRANGLFVVTPTYVRAARLEGEIREAGTGNPIPNAEVVINDPQANLGVSIFNGEYKTGIATAGTFDVTITATGYISQTVSATISNGTITILNISLLPIILPIELTSFAVEKNEDNHAILNWTAVSSGDQFTFEIERSTDGENFEMIAELVENGQNGFSQSFSYVDEKTKSGTNYYRIKLVDLDKSFAYSSVKRVVIDGVFSDLIDLFPNPLSHDEFLNIVVPRSNNSISLRVLNAQGAEISNTILANNATNQLSAKLFTEGLNFLIVEDQGEVLKVERLMVE